MSQKVEECRELQASVQEATSKLSNSEQRVQELEQNLKVWQTAAQEKEGAETQLHERMIQV